MAGLELNFGVAPCVYYMGCVKGGMAGVSAMNGRSAENRNGDKGGIRVGCLGV